MKTHRTQNLLFTMKKISAIIAAGALLAIGFNTSAYAQFKCQIPLPRDLVQLSNDNIILSHEQTDAEVYVQYKEPKHVFFCSSQWMKATEKDGKITIQATPNEFFSPRTAHIIITTEKNNVSRVITVTQNPEPGHNEYYSMPKGDNILPLADMDLSKATHDNFISEVLKNVSIDGHKIRIKNNTYESAIATHAKSMFKIKLNGAQKFVADIGIDDDILTRTVDNHGNVLYYVLLDGKQVATGLITVMDKKAVHLDIDTSGAKTMVLLFDTNGSSWGDHVDMGNPYFVLTTGKPELIE